MWTNGSEKNVTLGIAESDRFLYSSAILFPLNLGRENRFDRNYCKINQGLDRFSHPLVVLVVTSPQIPPQCWIVNKIARNKKGRRDRHR